MKNLFSNADVDFIFRFKEGNLLKTRESSQIEFKESFNWNNRYKYAKTLAAFANNHGGFLVFGVKDSPRVAIGLDNNRFTLTDEEVITNYLNGLFSPELIWEKKLIELNGKNFGLIYVCESINKPVIAKANAENIKESDIFYRYNGRSERIKFPELRLMIENERQKERNLWMEHMQKISRIGIDNLATIDLSRGVIDGDKQSIYVDENILHKIEFIKEGEFSEVSGSPTLRLVGDVQEMSSAVILPTRTKIAGIHTREIIEAMLRGKLHEGTNAQEYVESLPFERSKFMPIYFFLVKGEISINDAKRVITESPSTANQLKYGLVERLTEKRNFGISYFDERIIDDNLYFSNYSDFRNYCSSNNSNKQAKKALLYNLLKSDERDALLDFIEYESNNICEMITLLTKDEIVLFRELLIDVLLKVFDRRFVAVASNYRYAISHIDTLLYFEECH